ncbi:hypothetical protein SCHPADRAFT_598215 [Schizopora paradoxa]|uniref:Uncharacterized protein n=1 Tax=Schizopora paradoxa TaxID=27342 RepID=A0A0H2RV76_9AGAM|nr:hypothetical protein SCHPADRAFT_598215 [Schizopora paradoxa]
MLVDGGWWMLVGGCGRGLAAWNLGASCVLRLVVAFFFTRADGVILGVSPSQVAGRVYGHFIAIAICLLYLYLGWRMRSTSSTSSTSSTDLRLPSILRFSSSHSSPRLRLR